LIQIISIETYIVSPIIELAVIYEDLNWRADVGCESRDLCV